MKRISTGVEGLDKMLNGGLIPGRAYLIKGGPGAGKTTLAMQFLMEGTKKGEKCLYITFEEPISTLKEDMSKFGFDLDHPNIKLVDATPVGEKKTIFADVLYEEFATSFEKLTRAISEELNAENYSRIVIDPLTMIRLTIIDELEYRRTFMAFLKTISKYKATIILTSELRDSDIEEYLVSGVIELRSIEERGKTLRGIKITKFRGSTFDEEIRPYKITDKGIEVYHQEVLFHGV
ncbi:RAD55 family ATPase [Thermococcus alcaliphilus]|uniref:RAD55 family ATPase n=1 Tax=Thermococcus alcaliphilus TaxID=139207 RepID=UPI002091A32D|nr:ATPase domain-containing protein [Thermococcus alcaliphilus]MCO6042117.1 AAA family ATPase [Thermococcus alcaliphilus]